MDVGGLGQILTLLFSSYVTLGKLQLLCKFPHL